MRGVWSILVAFVPLATFRFNLGLSRFQNLSNFKDLDSTKRTKSIMLKKIFLPSFSGFRLSKASSRSRKKFRNSMSSIG